MIDEEEHFDPILYDTSDVEFTMKEGRKRNEVTLIAKSETDFNLVKYYLALKEFVEKIEGELNILENTNDKTH